MTAYEYYYLKKILNLSDHSYTMVLYQLSLYREEPILYSIYRVTPQPHINLQESQSSIPEDYVLYDQALTDRISILILSVIFFIRSGGSD